MDIKAIFRSVALQIKSHGLRVTLLSLLRRARARCAEWHYGIHTDAVIELSQLGISNYERKTPT